MIAASARADMSDPRRSVPEGRARTRILVVEDDDDVRSAVCESLDAEGYEVIAAANGVQALERLRSGAPPRLIVLDLMMPMMNGWQFRTAQRADPAFAGIPVIVMSAVGGDHVEAVQPLAAVAFLRKPFDLDTLLETVRRNVGV